MSSAKMRMLSWMGMLGRIRYGMKSYVQGRDEGESLKMV
jgi:hypothetical protein